jgi:predicted esterase
VLGFSQGVATATRWVTHGAVEPSRLVLWGDFTPPDLDCTRAALALDSVEVLMVRGEADAALASKMAAEEAERLGAAGIEYESILYRGGHDIEVDALRALISR